MKKGTLPLQKKPYHKYNKIWIVMSFVSIGTYLLCLIIEYYIGPWTLTIPCWLGVFGAIFSVPRITNDKEKGNYNG